MFESNNPNIILPVTLVERRLERYGDIYPGSLGFIFNIRILNTRTIEYKLLFIRFGKAGRDRLTKRTVRFSPTDVDPPFSAVDTIHKNSLLMGHNTFSGYIASYCLFIKSLHRGFFRADSVVDLLNKFDNKGNDYSGIMWTTKSKLSAIKTIRKSESESNRAITTMIATLNATFDGK